jgi:hypothetical protein
MLLARERANTGARQPVSKGTQQNGGMGHAGPSQLPRRLYRRAALRRPYDHAGIDVGHGVCRQGAPRPPRHADESYQSRAISGAIRQRCQHGRAGAAGRAVFSQRRQHRVDHAHRQWRRRRRGDAEQRGGPSGSDAHRERCRGGRQSAPRRGRLRHVQSRKHLQPDRLSPHRRPDRHRDPGRAGDVQRSQHEFEVGTVCRDRRQQRFAACLGANQCGRCRPDGPQRAGGSRYRG